MSGPVYCRLLSLLFGLVVLLQIVSTASALTTPKPTDSAAGGDCMPVIANTCFVDVAMDLACQSGPMPSNSSECRGRDAVDMCISLGDALNCTSDIIDSDCSASDGQLTYDDWLRGLRSVQSHLCANNATNMRVLIQPTRCWDPAQFLACMEQDAHVYQPSDLMHVKLDAMSCSGIQRASSKCASRANPAQCGPDSTLSTAVHTALSAFLLETPCRATCWQQPGQQPDQQPGQFSSGAVTAIVVLTALTLMLAGALAFVTYRTSGFRIPMARG